MTAVLRSGTLDWSGTCQATFAVPIWMLPVFLANLDRGGGGGMAAKAAAEKAAERDARIDDAVLGLIAACEYYILCFTSAVYLAANDGPKTAASVMFRTDFCSMYSSLTPAQRQAFQAWANGRAPGLLFEGGYNIGGEAWREPGLEIARWLASIWKPDDDKDLLSPPPGFQRHNIPRRESPMAWASWSSIEPRGMSSRRFGISATPATLGRSLGWLPTLQTSTCFWVCPVRR